MKKIMIISLSLLLLSMAGMAQADLISFDPDGAGGGSAITDIALMDWAPGNALAVGGNPVGGLFTGANITLLYQANLSTAQDANTLNLFSNGAGGDFFTAVAGFGEIATVSGATATFTEDPNAPSFFYMYATSALGSNLTGAGFTSATPIMTGHLADVISSSFTVTSFSGGNLDQSPNGNQWGTTQSVAGTGATNISIQIDSVDPNYFPSLDPNLLLTFSFLNTSQIVPYNQVDPSRAMSSDGITSANFASNIGNINGGLPGTGSGPNFLFQADANQSFATVPEPSTIILLGAGLFGIGIFGRKKMRK